MKEGEGDFVRSSFHGTDVAYIRPGEGEARWEREGKTQLVFIDLSTGKTKQILGAPSVFDEPAKHLPRDRYTVRRFGAGMALIEYSPKKDKYSLSSTRYFDQLLPASQKQREILFRGLDKLFVEAGAPVAKELVNVISNFI